MRTTDPTLLALYRLKARLGKERGFYRRLLKAYRDKGDTYSADYMRAYGEENACGLAQGMIDVEIRRAKGESS